MDDPGEDTARLEAAMRQLVAERLRLLVMFCAPWGVAFLPVQRAQGMEIPGWLVAMTIGFVASCGLAWFATRRAWFGIHVGNALGVVIGLMVLTFSAVAIRLTGEPAHFWTVPIVMIGAGVLMLYRVWLLVFLALGSALTLGCSQPPGQTLTSSLIVLAAGFVTSVLLHEASKRVIINLESLRIREQQQRAALEEALEEARKQLAEAQRAEAESARVATEGTALREQLAQSQKMESLGTLAGGFAHDMNNVLGGILGLAEMLREDAPAELHGDLDSIVDSTKRGAELTRNLLGFARRGKYRQERVQLDRVIAELLRLLTRTVPRGVVFATEIAQPSPAIDGDPSLIMQALVNLCLNSVDAMRGVGRIAIDVREVELDAARAGQLTCAPGRYVSIRVTDTGSGMDEATTRRIFEPFFTTKEVGRGTGLGLAMVHGTVQSYGGGVEAASEPGKGTTITLVLPVAAPAVDQPARPRSTRLPVVGGTILVVDDDVGVSRLARRILESKGYQVLEAHDGKQALARYAANPGIDLILLDMSMPVMSGTECFRALRAGNPDARVLLVSGYTMEQDARRCLDEGAVGFVDKPFTIESLTDAVGRALGR